MKRVIQLFPWRRQTVQKEQIAERYARSPNGLAIVRLHLDSPADLLMPFERFPPTLAQDLASGKPTPILNLNQELIDYLFARLAELNQEKISLNIEISGSFNNDKTVPSFSANNLHVIIQRYFVHLENVHRQHLYQLMKDSIFLGLLGLSGLGLSVILEAHMTNLDGGIGLPLLFQGVTVFGWLTFWEALANALWNWRPLYRQLKIAQRLQQAELVLATGDAPPLRCEVIDNHQTNCEPLQV